MSNKKSCADCVNLCRPGTPQVDVHGQNLPIYSCRSTGEVVATNRMGITALRSALEDFAEECDQYQVSVKPGSERDNLRVGIFSKTLTDPAPTGPVTGTCRACHFHVGAKHMEDAVGIPVGACAKFGNLIPEVRAAQIARGCASSHRVSVADAEQHQKDLVESLVVSPKLARYIVPEIMAAAESESLIDTSIDPTEYPTDRAVTPRQEAEGIRAWRRLTMGDREIFLPIFNGDFFTEDERAKIPSTGDDEHPETYVDHMNLVFTVAALWMKLDETPSVVGKAGTGKTELFRHIAWLMQLPFERISINRDSEIDDLAGKMHFENNETVFKPGRIPKAWVKPCVIVLDEPNTGPPEVWQYIRPLTDNSKQLVNDKNEGEVIKRHAFAFLGMAMNPSWDSRNVGAEMIGDADGSRLMHIFVDMPPREIEMEIIKTRCELDGYTIDNFRLEMIMDIAKSIRELSDDGTLPITWGVRNQIKVARALAWFDTEKAYMLGVLDYLEPSVKEMIRGIVETHEKFREKRMRKAGMIEPTGGDGPGARSGTVLKTEKLSPDLSNQIMGLAAKINAVHATQQSFGAKGMMQ